jgi:hypothetical protein
MTCADDWWDAQLLDLDVDFDTGEVLEDPRHVYPPHWRRRWPVHREMAWDTYIPMLPDIGTWNA